MTVKTDIVQIGLGTAAQNFHIAAPLDGTLRIFRGNPGAAIAELLRIDTDGKISTPSGGEMASTGDFKYVMRASAPAGWLPLNGSVATIGATTSGATRANNDTWPLFALWWTDYTDAQLPILTGAGAASTRGANAGADWDANKRLTVFDERDVFTRGSSATNVNGTLYPATSIIDNGGGSALVVAVLTDQMVRNADGLSSAVTTGYNMISTSAATSTPIGAKNVRPLNRPKLACVKL